MPPLREASARGEEAPLCDAPAVTVRIDDSLDGIDWAQAKADLTADDFDNGRSAEALRESFHQSQHVAFARDGDRVVGMARLSRTGSATRTSSTSGRRPPTADRASARRSCGSCSRRSRVSTSGSRPTTRSGSTSRSGSRSSPSSGRRRRAVARQRRQPPKSVIGSSSVWGTPMRSPGRGRDHGIGMNDRWQRLPRSVTPVRRDRRSRRLMFAAVVVVAVVTTATGAMLEGSQARPAGGQDARLQPVLDSLVSGPKRIAPGVTAYVSGPTGPGAARRGSRTSRPASRCARPRGCGSRASASCGRRRSCSGSPRSGSCRSTTPWRTGCPASSPTETASPSGNC